MHPGGLRNLDLMLAGIKLANPGALWLLIAVGVILAWSLLAVDTPRKLLAPFLRAAVLALCVLALADPQTITRTEGTTRPAVIDASASITEAMRTWTARLLRDDLKLRGSDPAVIFGTDAEPTTVAGALDRLDGKGGCATCAPGATDLEAALQKVAANPAAHDGSVVLVTDGWQNHGDAERALGAIRSAGIQLYIFTPPGARDIPNVAITGLTMPPALAKSEPFALSVTATNYNSTPVSGTISIFQNGRPTDARTVALQSGQQRFDFPVHAEASGLTSYTATFRPANPAQDVFTEDDSLTGWIGIGAQRKVLILTGSARDAEYLESVVHRMGLEPTVITASDSWSGSLKGYDAVVLNNVPRARLSPAAQQALLNYVEDGGSLAMAGGDESFGLGGYQDSPLARALPVIMKPPQHRERTRALVLIIDKSGSMGRDQKLEYAKAAARTVTKTLTDADLIAVIGFDSQPFVIVPLTPLSQSRPYFDELINRLKAHGTTYLLPAMEEAERMLASSNASVKHVVVLTDGETGGTAAMYYDLVSTMHREGGVTISTIAIGREANLALLESISKYGGGGFYQTDSASNLPEMFLQDVKSHGGEATMVERDFTPYTMRPDALLKDLGGRQLPAIKGFVATELKPQATLDAFINRANTRTPLIASWRYAAGKAVAVTTDASGRWSSPWIQDGIFSQVWSKVFSWMTPETAATEQKFDVALGYREGRIHLRLTNYSDRPAPSAAMVTAAITRPDGSRVQSALSEEVPGELYGSFDAPRPGTYNITLKASTAEALAFPPLAYTVSPAIDAELPRPEPNYTLLERLASASGGRLNPSTADVGLTRPEHETRQSMATWPLFAAMILLIGEALVRRLTF
ncbi:MAG TPA: VWA domain-containing protein [Candidatus Binataceae bacterium]|nr:VWA domain-containing protein [Candidatus Binataceae bacterium]